VNVGNRIWDGSDRPASAGLYRRGLAGSRRRGAAIAVRLERL